MGIKERVEWGRGNGREERDGMEGDGERGQGREERGGTEGTGWWGKGEERGKEWWMGRR